MGGMFLPKDQALSTCNSECKSCELEKDVVCHFNGKQLAQFFLMMAPPFIFGGKMIFEYSLLYFGIWIAFIILYFCFIEIWAMCSHCPHYAEPSIKSLKCWANYSAPKIWKYKPGPMSLPERIVFLAGMITVFLIPFVFVVLTGSIFNSIFYLILVVVDFTLLSSFFCTRCMNFACLFNKTPEDTRKSFFEKNPDIAKAWNK